MKFVEPNPFTDPDATARKLLEIANATEPRPVRALELVNAAFLKAGGAGRAVPRRYQEPGRQRLDGAARIRNLCEIHP
jgi:hypothetical protein